MPSKLSRPTLILLSTISAAALGATQASSAPQLYVNPVLGFNVEGYNYSQSEFPCQIDSVLVDRISEYAKSQGLGVEVTGNADKIKNADAPVLAMDIEALSLGEGYSFGTKSKARSNLPSVRVTAALIGEQFAGGFVTAEHSCAVATLSEVTPSSSVLDLGTYGVTVCSASHKCLSDLAHDIVRWAKPQVE